MDANDPAQRVKGRRAESEKASAATLTFFASLLIR
jgi:hypothetical protein